MYFCCPCQTHLKDFERHFRDERKVIIEARKEEKRKEEEEENRRIAEEKGETYVPLPIVPISKGKAKKQRLAELQALVNKSKSNPRMDDKLGERGGENTIAYYNAK